MQRKPHINPMFQISFDFIKNDFIDKPHVKGDKCIYKQIIDDSTERNKLVTSIEDLCKKGCTQEASRVFKEYEITIRNCASIYKPNTFTAQKQYLKDIIKIANRGANYYYHLLGFTDKEIEKVTEQRNNIATMVWENNSYWAIQLEERIKNLVEYRI